MDVISIFKHLLPTGRAWRITTSKALKSFFEGLSGGFGDVKTEIDTAYQDLYPQTTNYLDEWEKTFGLRPNATLTEQQRRDRLDVRWKATGGQSPRYIQDVLQSEGYDVYVHDWWEAGSNPPIARNPFTVLADQNQTRVYVGAGNVNAFAGGNLAFANSNNLPSGYPLVNIIKEATQVNSGAGFNQMYARGLVAYAGREGVTYVNKKYIMPTNTNTYPYYIYIGGENYPDMATVPTGRRSDFEQRLLELCPLQNWIGVLVNYN